jgi:hypothetical protein
MTDFKKTTQDFTKLVSDAAVKVGEAVNTGVKNVSEYAKLQKKKMEIKAQIGEHNKALAKNYEVLGKAYFEAVEKGEALTDKEDIIRLIRSDRSLVSQLEAQLKDLDSQEEEAPASSPAAAPAAETAAPEPAAAPESSPAAEEAPAQKEAAAEEKKDESTNIPIE